MVALAVTARARSQYGWLAGWIGTALPFLALTWLRVLPMGPDRTRGHAMQEDGSRTVADGLVTVGVLASIAAVAVILAQVGSKGGPAREASVTLALGALTLSWLLVHTVFALKYADLYYREKEGDLPRPPGETEASVDFGGEPRYVDFFYLAFTVGTTFAVSDTDVRSTRIRQLVWPHSLISFLFAAVIVGTTVNLVTSLIS